MLNKGYVYSKSGIKMTKLFSNFSQMLPGACTVLFKVVIHYESSVMHFMDHIPSGDFTDMVQLWY